MNLTCVEPKDFTVADAYNVGRRSQLGQVRSVNESRQTMHGPTLTVRRGLLLVVSMTFSSSCGHNHGLMCRHVLTRRMSPYKSPAATTSGLLVSDRLTSTFPAGAVSSMLFGDPYSTMPKQAEPVAASGISTACVSITMDPSATLKPLPTCLQMRQVSETQSVTLAVVGAADLKGTALVPT